MYTKEIFIILSVHIWFTSLLILYRGGLQPESILHSLSSRVMNLLEEVARYDGRSASSWKHFGHEALQNLLILIVVTCEGKQLPFKTYFYSKGKLWVPQAN